MSAAGGQKVAALTVKTLESIRSAENSEFVLEITIAKIWHI